MDVIHAREMKICIKCNIPKSKEDFGSPNICKKCISDRTKRYRKTPRGKDKHNKSAKEFHKRNREKILLRWKNKRDTDVYKEYMKSYRGKRKNIIFAQEVVTKNRYLEKNKKIVSDEYCIAKLKEQLKIQRLDITSEMIEVKRVKILIKRLRNNIAKIKRESK